MKVFQIFPVFDFFAGLSSCVFYQYLPVLFKNANILATFPVAKNTQTLKSWHENRKIYSQIKFTAFLCFT